MSEADAFSVGDRVIYLDRNGIMGGGRYPGVVSEQTTRRSSGTVRYTVKLDPTDVLPRGREMWAEASYLEHAPHLAFLPPDVGVIVGMTWPGEQGPRYVRAIQTHEGHPVALVSTKGSRYADIVRLDELAAQIEIEQRQARSTQAARARSDARAVDEQAQITAERAAYEDVQGYLDSVPALQRAHLLKVLNKMVWVGLKGVARKDHIRTLVEQEGWRVRTDHGGDLLEHPDGRQYHRVTPWVTQTGMNYARWLQERAR